MRARSWLPLLAVAAVLAWPFACDDRPAAGSDAGEDADTETETDAGTGAAADSGMAADAGADTDTATDSGTATDAGADAETDAGTSADAGADVGDDGGVTVTDGGETDAGEAFIRFVALGDQGKGNDKQNAVGAAIKTACDARGGCDFAILLGDNFYPSGVESVDDGQWQTAFEVPYASVTFPFFAVLGNHDYGGDGAGWETWKAQHQIDYTQKGGKWRMPARHYTFTEAPVDFIALDTTDIFFSGDDEQEAQVPARIAAATQPWKIVLGHHPYKSNGRHGNAGEYEGVSWLPIVNGRYVKDFIEDHVCGKADLYLCGHDHNIQDLAVTCSGTQLIVSGGGASTTELEGNNPVHFQTDQSGFVMIEATPTTMTFLFFDSAASKLHERTITKP
jgi:hypothetical protein